MFHPFRWVRRAVAIVLVLGVGVLDHQAFQWVPLLHRLYLNGLGHALLLMVTGLLAGFLFRSWWSLGLTPLAYLAGYEAAADVVSRSLTGITDAQHLTELLHNAGGAAALTLLGAGLATALMKGAIPWPRRRPHGRPGAPPPAAGHPDVHAPVAPRAGQTSER